VHGGEVRGIHADRGLLAGCGFAVHYLKAMMNRRVKGGVGVMGYVDDVVLQDESGTLKRGAGEVKGRFLVLVRSLMVLRGRSLCLLWLL